MQTLHRQDIIDSARGFTRSELAKIGFAPDFDEVDFGALEYYGWRDPKLAKRAYLTAPLDGSIITLLLTRADAKPRRRAMCSWCRDVNLGDDAVLYTARKAGPTGRRGDTLGVLVCENFHCSRHVRQLPPAYHKATDLAAIRDKQIAELQRRVGAFVESVLASG